MCLQRKKKNKLEIAIIKRTDNFGKGHMLCPSGSPNSPCLNSFGLTMYQNISQTCITI